MNDVDFPVAQAILRPGSSAKTKQLNGKPHRAPLCNLVQTCTLFSISAVFSQPSNNECALDIVLPPAETSPTASTAPTDPKVTATFSTTNEAKTIGFLFSAAYTERTPYQDGFGTVRWARGRDAADRVRITPLDEESATIAFDGKAVDAAWQQAASGSFFF